VAEKKGRRREGRRGKRKRERTIREEGRRNDLGR